jgi:uncharacterized membrane protein YcjF (UPF0283 family)
MKYIFLFLALLLGTAAQAQQNNNTLDDFFRTDDKFYVVVGVLTLVLVGILIYVIRLDRKVAEIEKNFKNQ